MTGARLAVLAPAVIVAAGAVAATAHGGYEVAAASGVPQGFVAALYPVITDGLALVAYAATHRLTTPAARRYAWAVVILAAGLSGLAQAVYLAAGSGLATPPLLRFGVGAWPAVAGAVAAHLVYLLAHRPAARTVGELVAAKGGEEWRSPGEDVAETAPTRVALHLAPPPPPTPGEDVEAVQEHGEDDLAARVAGIVAEGGGRRTVMKELGVSEYEARRLLTEHREQA